MIPMTVRPKIRVCGRALAGIKGSNLARCRKSFVSVVCCQVEVSASH